MTNITSYSQIFKPLLMMALVSAFTLAAGMLRNKFAAIWMGPMGVGLISDCYVIFGLLLTFFGFGIQTSAVVKISDANAKSDLDKVSRLVLGIRRYAGLSGFVGMVIVTGLSPILSHFIFGSVDYSLDIIFLGAAIFVSNLQLPYLALAQGMRLMKKFAMIQICSTSIGTLIALMSYYFGGFRSVALSLFLISISQVLVTVKMSQKIMLPTKRISWQDSFHEIKELYGLGITFMIGGVVGSCSILLGNVIITQQTGLNGLGIYSAAFALSVALINFILNAMSADYFPRLCEVSNNNIAFNRLMHEQLEVGALLAAPAMVAIIFFAPTIIHVFYTPDFLIAEKLLPWFALGCFCKVISWGMGYAILAKNQGRLFLLVELTMQITGIFLIYLGIINLGLEGVAVGFFCLNVLNILITYFIANRLSGFCWSYKLTRLVLSLGFLVVLCFCFRYTPEDLLKSIVNYFILLLVCIISIHGLLRRLGFISKFIGIKDLKF